MQQQHEILSNAREKDPQRNHPKEVHRTNPKSFGLIKTPLQQTQHSGKAKCEEQSRASRRSDKAVRPKTNGTWKLSTWSQSGPVLFCMNLCFANQSGDHP